MELAAKRDRLFAEHERGALGDGDVQTRFVALMLDAPDDALALTLCDSMPDWFREQFRAYLHDNANVGYAHRCYACSVVTRGLIPTLRAIRLPC